MVQYLTPCLLQENDRKGSGAGDTAVDSQTQAGDKEAEDAPRGGVDGSGRARGTAVRPDDGTAARSARAGEGVRLRAGEGTCQENVGIFTAVCYFERACFLMSMLLTNPI